MPVTILDSNLRAGWEPDTPVSDSLVRRYLLNWAGANDIQGASLGGRTLRRDDFIATDVGRPSGLCNMLTFLGPLDASTIDDTLAAVDDFYGFAGGEATGPVFSFSVWPLPDLRPYGWSLMGHPPLMFRQAGGEAPPAPAGLRIERVENATALSAFEAIIGRGFEGLVPGDAEPGSLFAPGLLEVEQLHLWVGYANGQPVSASAAFVAEGINDVVAVATIPEAQRRGFGGALTWQATLADPSLPAVLFASDEGRPVYERMGYTPLFRLTGWYRDRPGAPAE